MCVMITAFFFTLHSSVLRLTTCVFDVTSISIRMTPVYRVPINRCVLFLSAILVMRAQLVPRLHMRVAPLTHPIARIEAARLRACIRTHA